MRSRQRPINETGKLALWKELTPPNPVGLLDLTPIRVSPDWQSYTHSPLNVLSQLALPPCRTPALAHAKAAKPIRRRPALSLHAAVHVLPVSHLHHEDPQDLVPNL